MTAGAERDFHVAFLLDFLLWKEDMFEGRKIILLFLRNGFLFMVEDSISERRLL